MSLESRLGFRIEELGTSARKNTEPDEDLESSQDQVHSEEEIESGEDRWCYSSYTFS